MQRTEGEKRERADSDESSVDSLDSKRVRLDEPQIQGLESVIRSLEEETNPPAAADMVELLYLLEASDDELGLPPVESIGEGADSMNSQKVDLSGENDDWLGQMIAVGIEVSDLTELQWRPETMPVESPYFEQIGG